MMGIGLVFSAASDLNTSNLSVRDTGIGIKKKDICNLFEAFNQLEDAKSRRYTGSGLGLTITWQMVHLLGGSIDVESTFGIGSRFDVQTLFGDNATWTLLYLVL